MDKDSAEQTSSDEGSTGQAGEQGSGGHELFDALSPLSREELQQKFLLAEQKATELRDELLREKAASANLLTRTQRDVTNAHKYALEKFVGELIPIVDGLELCLTRVPDEIKAGAAAVVEGVELTLKMFYAAMDKFGIQQVNPVGEKFNPEFQQAISMQFDASAKPGTVISVLQKGYTLNQRLVRPALVVVAKEKE